MSENQEKLNEQLFNVIANDKDSDEVRLKKLKYLVYLGADVNVRLYGKSVLSKAIEQNAGIEVQNFLREKGAKEWVIPKEEAKKLSQGFWDDEGDLKSNEEIKELLKKGADVNAKSCYWSETALFGAAYKGEIDAVKCLAQNGADLNAKDEDGLTALMMAARWGNLDVVKYLVEHGADVNAKGEDGRTALMYVASSGCLEVVEYLVVNGADLEAKNKSGRMALDIARKCGKADCVEFLEEAQKKISAQKNKGDKTSGALIVKANEGR